MADLRNDTGSMRFALALVARDGSGRDPPAEEGGAAPAGRVLVTAGLDYLDARDAEWWPMVRLPPLHFEIEVVERLLAEQSELLRGASPGFAWRPGDGASVALQIGSAPGGALVEVGLDLGGFLADTARVALRVEADLALFRFRALQQDLVRFAGALADELEALRR